jgi:hypothetical protein
MRQRGGIGGGATFSGWSYVDLCGVVFLEAWQVPGWGDMHVWNTQAFYSGELEAPVHISGYDRDSDIQAYLQIDPCT